MVTGEINQNTAKTVLAEMFESGEPAEEIIAPAWVAAGLGHGPAGSVGAAGAGRKPGGGGQLPGGQRDSRSLALWSGDAPGKGQANPQVIQEELDEPAWLPLKNQSGKNVMCGRYGGCSIRHLTAVLIICYP